jgi:PAS domain S-box-containing protein
MAKNKLRILVFPYTIAIFIMMVLFEALKTEVLVITNIWLSQMLSIFFITLVMFVFLLLLKRAISQHYNEINQELTNANVSATAANQQLQATNQELQATEEELRSTNDELVQQKQDMDILFHAIPEGIIRTDEKGKVLFCNKLILEGSSLRREDLVNKDIKNIVLPEDRPMFNEEFSKVALQGKVRELSFHNLKGIQMLADITLMKDNKNQTIGTLSAIREFAKTSKIIEELDNSRKELHQKIEEMQILHRTTVDREKRIIALKEQVEILKQELAKSKGAQTL